MVKCFLNKIVGETSVPSVKKFQNCVCCSVV